MRPHPLLTLCITLCPGVTLGLLLAVLVAQPAFAASTIHVKTNGSAAGNGNSWSNAVTLQHALAIAGNGDQIWVASGIYTPGINSTDVFTVATGTGLYGGFAGNESSLNQRDWLAHRTILSGDIGGDDQVDASGVITTAPDTHIVGTNARHLLILDASNGPFTSTTRIDGLTMTAAKADGNGIGAGLYCGGEGSICTPHLENLIFSGNYAIRGALFNDSEGGGVASPTLVNVTFNSNYASDGGAIYNDGASGGIASPSLNAVTFTSNYAPNGGAIYDDGKSGGHSNPSLVNVTFTSNRATDGGAIYNDGSAGGESNPSLLNITFTGNHAAQGGAIYNDGKNVGHSNPTLVNIAFRGNDTTSYGGAIFNDGENGQSSPRLVNVVFTGNSASSKGGAIYNDGEITGDSSPTLVNVSFNGNTAMYGGAIYNDGYQSGHSASSLFNAILWGDSGSLSGSEIHQVNAVMTVTTSIVQGGLDGSGVYNYQSSLVDGGGNLGDQPGADPLFVDTAHSNLHLQSGSPAIDAGTNSAITQPTNINLDLDNNPRKLDGDDNGTATVDMGAYEFQLYVPLTLTVAGNGSGQIAITPAGKPCNAPCKGLYLVGSAVTLTATAATGSTFDGWGGACSGKTSCHLNAGVTSAVTATFSKKSYAITLHTAGAGSGAIKKQPDQASYFYGTVVLLSAEANSDSTFSGWGGDCKGHSDCQLTMDGNKTVTAGFTRKITPSFTSTPGLTATVGLLYSYAITASEADASVLSLAAPVKPGWLTLALTGNGTATLSGTPASASLGANAVQLRVQNEASSFATQNFTITVSAAPTSTPNPTLTGGVQGHVQDAQGKGLAGAQVTLSASGDASAAGAQSQVTNASGDYHFSGLSAGDYTLAVSDAGMQPASPRKVTVQAGKTTTVPAITLRAETTSKSALHLPVVDNQK